MIYRAFVIVAMLAMSLFAQVDWTHSYEGAKREALAQDKGIMLMISRKGCDACWYMQNIVFEDSAVQDLILNNFVPLYLDIDEEKLPEGFNAVGTPTFYFIKADGKSLGEKLEGASNVKDFTAKLRIILEELKK